MEDKKETNPTTAIWAIIIGVSAMLVAGFIIILSKPSALPGDSQSLTLSGICISVKHLCLGADNQTRYDPLNLGPLFSRLRSGPFEGPAIVKPPALPEDSYYF